MSDERDDPRALRAVFASREYRAIWLADLFSVLGDQLSRVALAVLVFDRTGSPLWSAAVYALTFLPSIAGGVLLGGLADRYPRRSVVVTADLARGLLIGVMAVPGLPLPVVCVLLVVAVALGAPYSAARGALLPEVLPGDLYERGLAVQQMTQQAGQVVGFAGGGLLVVALTPNVALALDAVTFLLAAVVLRLGLTARPASRPGGAGGGGGHDVLAGLRDILTDPRRRALVLLAWMVGLYVVPEALAAPYIAEIGASTALVGVLMAADPVGSVLGAWLFVRFVPPARRARLVGVLAAAAGLPLLLTVLRPGVPVAVVLFGLSGMLTTAYLLQTQASFVRATPDAIRGRALGVAASGIVAGQGIAVLAGGLVADVSAPSTAIAVCAAVGVLVAVVGGSAWWFAQRLPRSDRAAIHVRTADR
jgi:MFS family permease